MLLSLKIGWSLGVIASLILPLRADAAEAQNPLGLTFRLFPSDGCSPVDPQCPWYMRQLQSELESQAEAPKLSEPASPDTDGESEATKESFVLPQVTVTPYDGCSNVDPYCTLLRQHYLGTKRPIETEEDENENIAVSGQHGKGDSETIRSFSNSSTDNNGQLSICGVRGCIAIGGLLGQFNPAQETTNRPINEKLEL